MKPQTAQHPTATRPVGSWLSGSHHWRLQSSWPRDAGHRRRQRHRSQNLTPLIGVRSTLIFNQRRASQNFIPSNSFSSVEGFVRQRFKARWRALPAAIPSKFLMQITPNTKSTWKALKHQSKHKHLDKKRSSFCINFYTASK